MINKNSDYIEQFLKYLQIEKNYSSHTITSYQRDLKYFSDYFTKDLTKIKSKEIRLFLRSRLKENIKKTTYNRLLSTIKSLYKFFLANEIINTDPLININHLKLDKKLPLFLTKLQIKEVIENLPTTNFLDTRNKLLIEILYATGIRLAELQNLKVNDFNFQKLSLKVLGKGRKERIIPFSKKIENIYREYLSFRNEINRNDPFLFLSKNGNQLSRRQIQRVIKKIISDISKINQASPHTIRHSFATHLLDNGADIVSVKELLGHSSLSTTQIYTHLSLEKIKDTYYKSHPKA